jgi:hypothetical protein
MRIQLLKSFNKTKRFGRVMTVTTEKGNEWIANGTARLYTGKYPPTKKHKINLSQLKTK